MVLCQNQCMIGFRKWTRIRSIERLTTRWNSMHILYLDIFPIDCSKPHKKPPTFFCGLFLCFCVMHFGSESEKYLIQRSISQPGLTQKPIPDICQCRCFDCASKILVRRTLKNKCFSWTSDFVFLCASFNRRIDRCASLTRYTVFQFHSFTIQYCSGAHFPSTAMPFRLNRRLRNVSSCADSEHMVIFVAPNAFNRFT